MSEMARTAMGSRPGPKGVIPVTNGKAEDANVYTRNYFDSIHVEMRILDAALPKLETEIFGEKFSSPIMMPAFSHLNKTAKDGRKPMSEYAEAAKNLHVLNWVGMEPNEEYGEIANVGAKTVRIIKPFANHQKILEEIAFAEKSGAVAVGIDIDHIVGKDGNYDRVDGFPLGPVTQEDLRRYAQFAHVPFVAKGVLSVQDALKAELAGCSAIVVSHHHGRIPFGIAPAQILPRIKAAVSRKDMYIFADCSIDTGYDAYKALALGADAVSVGRGILAPLLKDGAKGVEEKVQQMNHELAEMMLYTGVKNTRSFDPSVLYL